MINYVFDYNMALINEQFIQVKTKANFESRLSAGEIKDTSIAFIEDTNEIWAKGHYYPCPYTKEELDALFNNKVDKESGKSLISNTLITKLENLDDQSAIDAAIADAKQAGTDAAILANNNKTTIDNYTVNGQKISTNPVLSKEDINLGNVTNDTQVKRSEMGVASGVATLGTDGKLTSSQLPELKTINNNSIVGSGNITIDLTLFKVVSALPEEGIDTTKIYLVESTEEGENNSYTEYMYVNSAWEKLGEYRSDVDLTNYVKFTDIASTSKAGAMSTAMVTKLNGIEEGANKTVVDSSLSGTSTNPIQNKVIKEALDGKASSEHTHENLTIKLNGGTTEGTNQFTYNGGAAKTLNITASEVGAASSSHTHPISQISDLNSSWDTYLKQAPKLINGATSLTNQDLNSYNSTSSCGWYFAGGGNTVTNKPSGVASFGLEIVRTASGVVAQILYGQVGGGNELKVYYRRYYESWTSWKKIADSDDLAGKANTSHTHSAATTSAAGFMSAADKTKLDGIATGANKYVHPTTSGNKHIPAGGSSGQILRWASDGTAQWGSDNNTTYSVFKAATASAAGGSGLVPAPAAGENDEYLRGDGTWATPPNTTYGNATTSKDGLMSSEDKAYLDSLPNKITEIEESLESATSGGLTGVSTSGTGSVIVNVSKSGSNIVATKGNLGISNITNLQETLNSLEESIETATSGGLTNVTTEGESGPIINISKDRSTIVGQRGSIQQSDVTGLSSTISSIEADITALQGNSYNTINQTGSGYVYSLSENGTTINVARKGITASEVSGLSTVATSGDYNDLENKPTPYTLPAAAANTLGGIKLGYTQQGKKYPIEIDANNKAYVNVPWIDTNTTYSNATASIDGLMSSEDKTKLDNISDDATKVSFTRSLTSGTKIGTINIDGTTTDIYAPTAGESVAYDTATTSNLGLVKLGSDTTQSISANSVTSTSGRTYAVQLNNNDQMVVNVPWTNTTYNNASSSSSGLMSASDKQKLDGIASGANNYTLPTASSSTLGGIKIGNGLTISNGVVSVSNSSSGSLNVVMEDSSNSHYVYSVDYDSDSNTLTFNKSAISISEVTDLQSTINSINSSITSLDNDKIDNVEVLEDGFVSSAQISGSKLILTKTIPTQSDISWGHSGSPELAVITPNGIVGSGHDPEQYALESYVDSKIGQELSGYATQSWVNEQISDIDTGIQSITQSTSGSGTGRLVTSVSGNTVYTKNISSSDLPSHTHTAGQVGGFNHSVAVITDSNGFLGSSGVTVAELACLSGCRNSIQSSIDTLASRTSIGVVSGSTHYLLATGYPNYYNTGIDYEDVALINKEQTWSAYQNFQQGAGQNSDIRFKENIKPLSNVLEDLNKLEVFEYTWNHPNQEVRDHTIGMNANQIEEMGGFYSLLVHKASDEYETRSLEYNKLGVLAIKGLQEINEKLEKKCNKLENILKLVGDKLDLNINELLKEN